ncbi:diaminopimelate decarboxylase [Halorubrum ezzemoulense]|uniref:Diaminopimelate decarboxylase n=1 Tax=Halorubrum ezzemoulense TaxID=337243 RepID=A0A256JYV7_HALEZ|nr:MULTISPECIES: diaminopimelate decarboxylase [Halorubrum]MDB9248292.1 diaminopimelate decarboxylase [Halorubrum ezzemoulense]MDB9257799.1 diaminopimelate decarboxylase [Halorubrum ezzemoulense]MDB9261839.1 diaminopimelate decarboxylase [Halorubrum ezzemoulense]MDB9265342.1 diaminopimelate decarboxylase [Halorubrum ezzemoulense]MDB9268160.1 diaminopimelate decarboxylase [Halorubrum ezzemoulense]
MSDAEAAAGATDEADGDNPPVRRVSDWDAGRLRGLADAHGTPLYVQDLDRVRENCERLLAAFPDADVRYAVKAHTGQAVLETVRDAGLDAECASAGEVDRALAAGFDGSRLHYTAVNPPARDLDYVAGVAEADPDLTVTVGAVDTLDRLAERGYDGRVCVRVNPGVGAGHHEKVTTGGAAKFGVPYDRAAEVTRDAAERFDAVGVHAHAGSGIDPDQLDSHRELVARMGDLARELTDPDAEGAAPLDLEYVDVGGGFGVPYEEDAPALDLPAVADATREAVAPLPEGVDLAIEPGRYVVADAGVLLARVNTVKPTPDETVVGVDAGMTDLLRPAMYDAYHPIRNLGSGRGREGGDAPPVGEREATPVTVAGPICETGDAFCENRALAEPVRGDLLAVGVAGAYGYEMASQYNSRPRPAEVALDDGTATIARRRETLGDLTTVEREIPRDRAGRSEGDR